MRELIEDFNDGLALSVDQSIDMVDFSNDCAMDLYLKEVLFARYVDSDQLVSET